MVWNPTVYSLPPLVAAGVSLLLAVYGFRYREEDLARVFVVLVGLVAAWSLAYAIQLGYATVHDQRFWLQLSKSLGATVPVIWLIFAIIYAGHGQWLSRRTVGLLFVEPVAYSALVYTNPRHGPLWTLAESASRAGPGLDPQFTALYLAHLAYAYLAVAAGVGLVATVFFRSSAIYRRQSGLLVLGAVVPLSANVAFTAGVGPAPGLDLTTSR